MKKQNVRIAIPLNPTLLILLAVAIKIQHEKLGIKSPLAVLDWEKNGPVIGEAAEVDGKLQGLEKELEKLFGRRKVLLDGSLSEFVRSCRDVLTGTCRGELRKLIDFGFEVDDTPKAKKTTADKKAA